MDRVKQYQKILEHTLLRYAEYTPSHGNIEMYPIFDESRGHYLLLGIGWDRNGRVHSTLLHCRLQNGKVWLEQENTDTNVAEELVAAGIAKEDIVLGFYRPERRALTEFAVV